MEHQQEIQEKEALRRALQEQLAAPARDVNAATDGGDTAGSLDLHQLNPEISVTGDLLASWQQQSAGSGTSDFSVRGLALHVASWLDPGSRFKAALPFSEDGAELEEAYVELHQIADSLVLTLGKFRQPFGVVNRWHKHALDQVDHPLSLRQIFGDEGLNQTGLSVDWLMPPLGSASQKLTVQVTDGQNERLFGGNTDNRPALLGRYSLYRDLSEATYLETGFSGLLGWNDSWDMAGGGVRRDRKATSVFALDATLRWEPTDRMRYRNLEWRSEAYRLQRNLLAPDGSGGDSLRAWGLFSYVQAKLSRTWDVGVRGDLFVPDTKGYAEAGSVSLAPLAVTAENAYRYQVCPYATWSQSPFVRFRAEYDYGDGRGMDLARHVVWLQTVFAAGPHKHERY